MTRREDEAPDSAEANEFGGERAVHLLAGESDTNGTFALIELSAVRGGPPRHCHAAEDETVYCVAGELILDNHASILSNGECIVLPQGRDHTYRVKSEEERLLVLLTPAGLESSYLDGAWHGDDFERLVAVAARYGIEVTGPPLEMDGESG